MWNSGQLADALHDVGVGVGDCLFVHSNVGWLGRPESGRRVDDEVLTGLRLAVGERGSLLLPGFSYSFGRGEVFDPDIAPLDMGVLTVRAHELGFLRSQDPMFSMYGYGLTATEILRGLPPTSFGEDSVFARMRRAGVRLVSINLDAGSTYCHHIEWLNRVPYRFEKQFRGRCRVAGGLADVEWTTYVRDLELPRTEAHFGRLTTELKGAGLWRTARIGRGFVGAVDVEDLTRFVSERLPDAPDLLVRGDG